MFEVDSWDVGSEKEEKLVRSLFGGRKVGKRTDLKQSKETNSYKKKPIKNSQIDFRILQKDDTKSETYFEKPKKRKSSQLEATFKNDQHQQTSDHELPKKLKQKYKDINNEKETEKNRIRMKVDRCEVGTKEKKDKGKNTELNTIEVEREVKKKKKRKRKSNNKFINTEKSDGFILSTKTISQKQFAVSHGPSSAMQSIDFQDSMLKQKPKELTQLQKHPSKKSELQEKLKQKLESSRFRWINEQLYTIPGDKAFSLFKDDTSLFDVYHQGFRRQVEQWPVNPVDVIIGWIKERYIDHP